MFKSIHIGHTLIKGYDSMLTCAKEDINREKCNRCMYLIEYIQEERYECMLFLKPNKEPFIYGDQQLLSKIK